MTMTDPVLKLGEDVLRLITSVRLAGLKAETVRLNPDDWEAVKNWSSFVFRTYEMFGGENGSKASDRQMLWGHPVQSDEQVPRGQCRVEVSHD